MSTLRIAAVEDLPRLAHLAEEFYSSTDVLHGFHLDRFIALWTTLLGNGSGVVFLLEKGGEIIGTIGGVCYPETYSPRLISQEFHMFIAKEHRGGFGLLKLMRAFENWAREKGCTEVRIAHLHDLQPERLGPFYQRLGYKQLEVNYMKKL